MTINKRIILGFAIVLSLFTAVAVSNIVLLRRIAGDAVWARHSSQVIYEAGKLQNGLAEVRTVMRSYLVDGDKAKYTKFLALNDTLKRQFTDLRNLVRDNPQQQKRLSNIESLYKEWLSYTAAPLIILREDIGVHPNIAGEYNVRGNGINENITLGFKDFDEEEIRLQRYRQHLMDSSIRLTNTSTGILTIVALVAGIITANYISRSIRQRIKTISKTTEEIASGRLGAVIADNTQDELNVLVKSVNQMSLSLQKMVSDLRKSNEELEQFAWVASHDLKEPLRMVSLYSQMIGEKYTKILDEEGRSALNFMQEGVKRMYALINNLLEYSRIDKTGGTDQAVNARILLKDVIENLKAPISETGASITTSNLDVSIEGNPFLLGMLFQNLVQNAIKFQKPGERPEVSVSCTRGKDGKLLFAVKDNGIGIEEQYKDRIFVIFQRLHDRNKYAGTGIGLSISKKIVELHGGTIWMESQPQQGTTFFFTLSAYAGQ